MRKTKKFAFLFSLIIIAGIMGYGGCGSGGGGGGDGDDGSGVFKPFPNIKTKLSMTVTTTSI